MTPSDPSTAPTAVEIFAGGGLMSLALAVEGVSAQHHCELDASAAMTIRLNLDAKAVSCDVRAYSPQPVPGGLDLLVGGPPCQPWSQGGVQKGKDDPRNLWPEVLRLMDEARPRVVLMENVHGILHTKHQPYLEWWWGEADALGYTGVIWKVLGADYGSPQRRGRVWFVLYPKGASWGEKLQSPPPATHVDPRKIESGDSDLLPWVRAFDQLNDGCCGGFGYFSCVNLGNLDGMCGGCVGGSNYEMAENDTDDEELSDNALQYLKSQESMAKHPPVDSGGIFAWDELRKGQRRTTGTYLAPTVPKGKERSEHFFFGTREGTLPIGPEGLSCPIDEWIPLLRQLTVRDVAKLQSVPQWYVFHAAEGLSDAQRTRAMKAQVGNGIDVNMGRAVTRYVLGALGYSVPRTGSIAAQQADPKDTPQGLWPLYRIGMCEDFAQKRLTPAQIQHILHPPSPKAPAMNAISRTDLADVFDVFAEILPEFAPKLRAGGLDARDLDSYAQNTGDLYVALSAFLGESTNLPVPAKGAFDQNTADVVAELLTPKKREVSGAESIPAILQKAAKDLRKGKMKESGATLRGMLELLYEFSGELGKPQKKLPRAKPAAPAAPVKPVFTSKASSKLDSLGRMAQLRDYYNDGSAAYFSALIEAVKAGHIWPSAIVGGGLRNPKQAALTYLAGKLMDASVVAAPAAPAPAPAPAAEVLGRYAIRDGKAYADSGALRTAAKMPGASLEHMGLGEFYVQTPQGRIDFHRRDSMAEDFPEFSGRVHYVTGDPVEALTAFVDWMRGYPEIVETGGETVVETVVDAPDMGVGEFRDLMVAGSFGAFTTPGIVQNTFDYLGHEAFMADNRDGTFSVWWPTQKDRLGSFSDPAAAIKAVQQAVAPAPAPAPAAPTVDEVKRYMHAVAMREGPRAEIRLSKETALPTDSEVDVGLMYTTASKDDAWRVEKDLRRWHPYMTEGGVILRQGSTLGITLEDGPAWRALSLAPAPAAPATGQRRTGWLDPALGRIEILVGQGKRRGQSWSNIRNGGTRFGWNGTRWARNLVPSQKLLKAVFAEGWAPEFGLTQNGSIVLTGSASAPASTPASTPAPTPVPTQPLSQAVAKWVLAVDAQSAVQTTDDRGNPLKVWVEQSKSRGARLVTQREWKGRWAKPKARIYDEFGALALSPGGEVYYVSARTPEAISIRRVSGVGRSGEGYTQGTSWSGSTGAKDPGYDAAAMLLGWTPAATSQWAANLISRTQRYAAAEQARDAKEAAEAAAAAAGTWVPDPLPTLREIKGLTVGKGAYRRGGTKIEVQGSKPEEVATVSKTKGRPARWSVRAGIKDGGFIRSSHATPSQSGLESPEDVLRILEEYRQTGTFSGSLAQSLPGIFVSNPARSSNPLRALKS